MIIRTIHNKENPYFQLNRAAVSDERLSYKAIGIHTYLMSKPDGWEANENDIAARHAEGRAAIRSGIQELIDFGYMVRVQLRKNKKVESWRLDTYETPDLNPHYKPDQPAKVITIDLDLLDLEFENLNVGLSNNVYLECEKLQVENLQVENRTHSNYIDIENKEGERVGPPPSPAATTADPLMDAAKRKWQLGKSAPTQSWQAELNLELEAKRRVPLAAELARVSGWEALIDAGDDKKNEECHRAAIFLYKMGIATPGDLKNWYADYLSDTWARDKNPNPRPEKVKELVSKKAAAKTMPAVRATNGNTASYRAAPSDLFGMEQ